MNRKSIIDAYSKIRTIDHTIPDEVLDFMNNAALLELSRKADQLTGYKNGGITEEMIRYTIYNNTTVTEEQAREAARFVYNLINPWVKK